MKTSNFKLESLFLAAGLILFSLNVSSQDINLSKQEKKEAEKARQYLYFQSLDTLLRSKSFVLEADWLENQYGNKVHVLSNLNFIMVDSLKAVLQTGNNISAGTNGVGGATAEGSISGMKIEKDLKHLSFYVRFTVSSDIGIYDVSMNIFSGNSARATISGFSRGKLVYDGRIEALYNSRVFKGRNTI